MNESQVPTGEHDEQPAGKSGAGSSPEPGPDDTSRPDNDTSSPDDGSERRDPSLAPIPAEGTSAPADADRVFGRSGGTSAGNGTGARSAQPQPPSETPPHAHQPARQDDGAQASPAGRQPSEEVERRLRHRGRLALIFGLAAVVIGTLLFPSGFAIGLLLGVAAFAFGIAAWSGGRRAGMRVPGALPGILIGAASLVLSLMIAISAAMFWTEWSDYAQCSEGANTQTARDRCTDELYDQLEKRGVGPLPAPPRP